ncbi:MAG: uroporphyrinogen-III synthase [Burkholderiaceae bacterium]
MAAFVLTQPLGRVDSMRRGLQAAGHSCVCLPFSRLHALADGLSALARLMPGDQDRIIFVSPASVAIAASVLGSAWHGVSGVCAIGAGTAEALFEHGVLASGDRPIMPDRPPYDADSLLPLVMTEAVGSVAVIKGEGGRRDWLDSLRSRGIAVSEFVIYGSRPVTPDAAELPTLAQWLAGPGLVVSLLSSRAAIEALAAWPPIAPSRADLFARPALAVHPNVAEKAREVGFTDVRLLGTGQSLLAGALALADASA